MDLGLQNGHCVIMVIQLVSNSQFLIFKLKYLGASPAHAISLLVSGSNTPSNSSFLIFKPKYLDASPAQAISPCQWQQYTI